MAKKNNTRRTDSESRIKLLEERVTKLEIQLEKKLNRCKGEYTEEEKKAIRARLLGRQEAALKRRGNEARDAKRYKANNSRVIKAVEIEKPIEA
jgi:hypothetical protein